MNRKRKEPLLRFWFLVKKTDDCWIFTGAKAFGYGMFWDGKKHVRAHRFIYEQTKGSIPEGLNVLHRCDNPSCVNPNHLFIGTHQDNMDDMAQKGRRVSPSGDLHWSRRNPDLIVRGEGHSRTKLSSAQIQEILSGYTGKRGERSALARKYGVSGVHIGDILRGKTRHAEVAKYHQAVFEN